MTTHAEFITSVVSTLSVTGVTRQYTEPPASLNNADLPASYPESVQITQDPLTFGSHGGNTSFFSTFVIACEPAGLGTAPTNFNTIVELSDNLDTALRVAVGTIGQGSLKWDIRGGVVAGRIEVAGNEYWGIRCFIEAKGHGGA
ncbi:MAG: hypothetical protein WBE28_05885 [bacterium]